MAKAPTKVKKKPSASKLKVQSASKPREEVKLDPKTAEANKKQLELALAIPKVVSLKPGSKETISSSKLTQTKAADIKKQVLALAQTGKKNEGKVEKVPKSAEDYAAEKNDKKESGGTKPCENGGKKKKKGDDENNDKSSDGKKTHKKSSVEEKKDDGKKTDEKSSDGKKTHKKSSGEDKTDDGKKTNKKSSGEEKKDDGNGKKTNKKSSAEEKKDDAVGSDPSTQPAARKGVLRNPGGKPAPKVDVTPPTKRVLIKSPDPSQTPSTTASEESLHAKKKREAEEALLTRKDLREACKKARLEADFDAAGMGSFLQNFADDPADPKCGQVLASKMASKLAEAPPQKMESEDEDEEESEDSSDGQEEEGMDTDDEEEEEAEAEEECEGGEEGRNARVAKRRWTMQMRRRRRKKKKKKKVVTVMKRRKRLRVQRRMQRWQVKRMSVREKKKALAKMIHVWRATKWKNPTAKSLLQRQQGPKLWQKKFGILRPTKESGTSSQSLPKQRLSRSSWRRTSKRTRTLCLGCGSTVGKSGTKSPSLSSRSRNNPTWQGLSGRPFR